MEDGNESLFDGFDGNDACFLLGRNHSSKVSFVRVSDETFDTRSELAFPSVKFDEYAPALFAVERVNDTDSVPFCDCAYYNKLYLFDEKGSKVASCKYILTTYSDPQSNERLLEIISEGFALVFADWSDFFLHPFFSDAPKDTGLIMFIESVWVHEKIRQRGFGKWMLAAALREAMSADGYVDIHTRLLVGLISSLPCEIKDKTFNDKAAKLTDFYKQFFKSMEKTPTFQCVKNFTMQEDVTTFPHPMILCWSAGGKKGMNK